VPQYTRDREVGLFPFDAQVWFRIEGKEKGRDGNNTVLPAKPSGQ
jgi:hypothetical protein